MTWIMVIFINPDFKRRVDELLLRQDETSTVQRKPNDNPRAGEGDDSQAQRVGRGTTTASSRRVELEGMTGTWEAYVLSSQNFYLYFYFLNTHTTHEKILIARPMLEKFVFLMARH